MTYDRRDMEHALQRALNAIYEISTVPGADRDSIFNALEQVRIDATEAQWGLNFQELPK